MHRGLELSKPDDVLRYLSETPFASSQVEPLFGGTINYVFRLYLRNPYDGMRTLIMKHGKGRPSGHETYSFSVERQTFEAKALEIVNTVIPDDSLVKVPRLYHYDKEEHVLIVEDCGADTQTLKQLLKDGSLDLQACRTIGRALGTFLATVHRECSKDQKLLQYFHNSTKMKGSCAPLTRVVSTLTGERKTRTGEAVVDPPLENSLPDGTIQKVERIVQEMTQAIGGTTVKRFFTMGDFQTQNVIIKTSGGATGTPKVERVFVIDWEDTKPGHPYMDFGHFVAEMHSLRRFYEGTAKETVDETLKEYFTAYKQGYQVDEVFLRGAIAQVGAHLIESTPVMGWDPKEKVRAVVAEGVEYLDMSRQRKLDLFKKGAIIDLVGENEEGRDAEARR